MRRRRLLTGLSAASVAATLPFFVFDSALLAQDVDGQTLRIFPRLEGGEVVGENRTQYRLFLKSSIPVTLPRAVLQVHESYVRYAGGDQQALNVVLASRHSFSPHELRRRAPPRIPRLALRVESEVQIATLTLRTPALRNESAQTLIEMSLSNRRFTLPEVTLMA